MKDWKTYCEDGKDTPSSGSIKNNYDIQSAVNGQEALEIRENFSPKVISPDDAGAGWLGSLQYFKNDERHKLIYYNTNCTFLLKR